MRIAWAVGLAACPSLAQAQEQPDRVVYHVVEAGDTVFQIAQRYGSSMQRILRANRIRDARKLYVGTRLRVPLVPGRRPDPAFAGPSAVEQVDALLVRSEQELREARFEQSLATVGRCEPFLARLAERVAAPRRARLQVVRATAQVALGRRLEALESFEVALRADPGLELDPQEVSPKVMQVYDTARRSVAGP